MKRILLFSSIFLFWVLMVGWLWQRERVLPSSEARLASASRITEPVDTWLSLVLPPDASSRESRRVGYVHLQQIPESRKGNPGITTRIVTQISVELFGRNTQMTVTGRAFRPFGLAESDFEVAVASGDYNVEIEGEVGNGRLTGKVLSGGEETPIDLAIGSDLFLGTGVGTTLELPQLNVGQSVQIESFDPLTLRPGTSRVTCRAREMLEVRGERIPTRVLEVESSGLETRAWVDDQGQVVRAETPLGLTLIAVTPQEALRPTDSGDSLGEGLLELTAVKPTGVTPRRGATSMRFRISGGELSLPSDALQRSTSQDGFLRVTDRSLVPNAPPDSTEPLAPNSNPASWLAADPFVQSGHPEIIKTAQQIVGAEDSPRARALLLHNWVFENVEKSAALSVPSALEVLQQLRGDCNEHTVLYTALARALGLPTRIAIGLVWSDDLKGFYYHAWPEVLLENEWEWIDPTLGQPVADATHIKILNGGIETWPQLIPFLGKLELQIESIEP